MITDCYHSNLYASSMDGMYVNSVSMRVYLSTCVVSLYIAYMYLMVREL